MSALGELIASIEGGPDGPDVGAFFDFDGTLIAGYSASAFYQDRVRHRDISLGELARSLRATAEMSLRGEDVTQVMEIAVEAWKGRDESVVAEMAERVFKQRIAGSVYPESRELVRAHQRMGHTVALASSATSYQVEPMAADLGIEELLCTKVGVENGLMTGELAGPILWGTAKADAVESFAQESGVDLARSYAYANGDEDVAFLELVGSPHALNPASALARVARERSWPAHSFSSRGRLGLDQVVRTSGALAGLGVGAGIGAGIALLNRNRRLGVNAMATIGPELALGLAGVELNVIGEENLWSHRPAVFVFNHQSSIDMVVLGKLLRRDVTGVAKREAARDPRFAPFGYLADIVYIDRSDSAQAKAAMAPVVEKLRSGVSLAIAPEGTRSPTPRVGRFKKGAFHMAMQAGVPVVPIVIRNAGDVMWRNSFFLRSGTIDVAVLEPISVDDWTSENLGERVEQVRRRFVETIDRWPAEPS